MLGYEGDLADQRWECGLEDLEIGQELALPEPLFKKLEL